MERFTLVRMEDDPAAAERSEHRAAAEFLRAADAADGSFAARAGMAYDRWLEPVAVSALGAAQLFAALGLLFF